jgi:hypothetical protein
MDSKFVRLFPRMPCASLQDMFILGYSTGDTLLSATKRRLQEFMEAAKAKRSKGGNDGKRGDESTDVGSSKQ